MVICLERGADLHIAQLMALPLTVSCFSKIQIGFTFLVPAHLGSTGKRAVKRVFVWLSATLIIVINRRFLEHHNVVTLQVQGCPWTAFVGILIKLNVSQLFWQFISLSLCLVFTHVLFLVGFTVVMQSYLLNAYLPM